MIRIVFTEKADSSLAKIDKKNAERIIAKLYWLAKHPDRHSVLAAVKNPPSELTGVLRLRVGDYRIILWLENDTLTVYDVGLRSEVYKTLGRN